MSKGRYSYSYVPHRVYIMEEKRDDTVYVFYLKEKKMKKKGTQKIEKV